MIYYSKAYNLFNVIASCKNREFAVIPKARAFKVHSVDALRTVLNLIHWDKEPSKLYRSIAKLVNIPFFTFNMQKRSQETLPWFQEIFNKEVYEYDLFFDFDCSSKEEVTQEKIELVLVEVKKLVALFEEYGLPYYVQFSGNKGFHVFIDGKYLPKPELVNGQFQPQKRIQEKIRDALDLKYLDLSNNGVPNRLCKVPYSLCPTSKNQLESDMNMVFPLTDLQLEYFKLDYMRLGYIEQGTQLLNRGTLERGSQESISEKVNKVNRFIKMVDI